MTNLDSNFYRKQPKPDKDQLKRIVPTQQERQDGSAKKIVKAIQGFFNIFKKKK